ncbi:MAG: SUMF1/EgtB/PvdO family nonheme iron enzyme [Treponema sp.]|nr:SUMF1/EgtB/PvdO family nonheme iron enzyme [Treponema sp.]
MKKKLILTLALLLASSVLVFGQNNPESDFTFVKSGNRITITGYRGRNPVINIPPTIQDTPVFEIRNMSQNNRITSVTIPGSVEQIGNNAFANCPILESVFVLAATPPKMGANVFLRSSSGLRIYVPSTSVSAYKAAAGWSAYASRIVSADTAATTPPTATPSATTTPPVVTTTPPAQQAQTVTNTFIRINGGTFMIGSPGSDVQHAVTVSGFYMAKYPVTQKEYEEIMGNNPSNFKGPNLPVEMVTWYEAVEYCNKLSEKEGLTPAYTLRYKSSTYIGSDPVFWNRDANGYRLPTEAEWEYACRAGTTTLYNTGDNITTDQANYRTINTNVNIVPRYLTTVVGSYPPNAWGLHDMHGNVYEWCWDYSGGNYPGEVRTDPVGPLYSPYGDNRVMRGGAFDHFEVNLRSASRSGNAADNPLRSVGFRVVRPLN